MRFDVTEGVSFVLSEIIGIIGYCFNLLDSIKMGDTSLLTITLSMFLLSALIPVLFSVLAYRARRSEVNDYVKSNMNTKYYEPKE